MQFNFLFSKASSGVIYFKDVGHLISTILSSSIEPSGLAAKNVKFLFIKKPQGNIYMNIYA
jgi:hypothetical protein